jgi:hypothetical protein
MRSYNKVAIAVASTPCITSQTNPSYDMLNTLGEIPNVCKERHGQ